MICGGGYRILVILGLFFSLCGISSVAGVKKCHECRTIKSKHCENPIDCSKSATADNIREMGNVTLPTAWYCWKSYSEGDGQNEVEKECRAKDDDEKRTKCADPKPNDNHGKPITTVECDCDDQELCNGGHRAKISLASFILLGVCAYNNL